VASSRRREAKGKWKREREREFLVFSPEESSIFFYFSPG